MIRIKKKRIKRLSSAVLCILTVLSLLVGTAPWNSGFVVQAAVAPTLSITSGTPYFYSIAGSNPKSVAYGTATATTSVMSASMSGNVVTIKENSASKLYELGYVPIVTSMAVPAKTAYQVTLSFTAEGKKVASHGSAVAFLEIYDFGSANYSNSLTFNMSDNATNSHATYTKLRAREDSKNTNFGGTYSTTVTFANTSASDKTISHYFGFFTGVHYGSSYDHTLTSTCTITAGKITDLDDIVPTVNASTSNLWHLIDGFSSAANNTQASSRFVQEKDSITQAEADLMGIPYRNGDYNGYWPMRASLTIGTNKLTIKNNGCTTLSCHMSYAPFSVPITVPAHMTRTYYLTFTIDYERNTGSGAGFFAELIQGDVPESFNTAASATMTGNTKLRVYSTDGDAHSGSVTIPLTLTNDTDSAQIHSEDFVFFAGHRKVGAYQPEPIFNLTLTDISYASYESDFGVTVNATNCTYTAPTKVGGSEDCSVTFTPKTGYSIPSTVTVKIGSSTLSASSYTYSSSTGKLTIPAKYITDAVTVTAVGVPNTYTITYSGLEGASLTTKPTTHTYGTATTVGNPTKTGYVFSGWKINSGTTAYKDLTLEATAYTGNITLTATWTKATYNATLSGSNVTASSGFGTGTVAYQTAWTGTFTANSGYVLPNSITVTVGGATLATSKYTYTKSTGTVTIASTYVTGNIVVTASGHKHSYTGTVTTPATCTTAGVKTFTCSCGDSYTEPIPATGHNWSTAWYYDSEQHWHICTNEGTTVTDTKTDHSFIWVVDREPTVSADGLRHEKCTVCDYEKPQETYTVDIVSVEITWGAMEFTYSDGIWNAETHTYEGEGWVPDETGGNKITAENNGNVAVSVSYCYTQTNSAVSGSFTDGQTSITASVALPVGGTKDVWLMLNGKPTESMNKAVLGSVTITVGGE